MRMFYINISPPELYDEIKEEFSQLNAETLQLEHSLVSLSKWESKWCKPFLSLTKEEKTYEESVDYVRCMTLNQEVTPEIYDHITNIDLKRIAKYMELPMTATTFGKNKGDINKEQITAEIIYYWMVALVVPFECQYWHLNRLLTLINVINIKQNPPKKMGKKDLMSRNAQLNAERKAKMNTKG